jgi:hypothetical protein
MFFFVPDCFCGRQMEFADNLHFGVILTCGHPAGYFCARHRMTIMNLGCPDCGVLDATIDWNTTLLDHEIALTREIAEVALQKLSEANQKILRLEEILLDTLNQNANI